MALVINPGAPLALHSGVLSGPFSQYSVIETTTLSPTISVQFKTGGASRFLPMPASELSNQIIDLSTLWGTAVLDLREQLQIARTPVDGVRLLEQFLLTRSARKRAQHPAVEFALASLHAGHHTIAEVTAQIGLSPKRFIHHFRETVGLTPKMYSRILRFQNTLRAIEQENLVSWTYLALDCGYFDQAHLIHDFQEFSGLTPRTYLAQRRACRNHIPFSN